MESLLLVSWKEMSLLWSGRIISITMQCPALQQNIFMVQIWPSCRPRPKEKQEQISATWHIGFSAFHQRKKNFHLYVLSIKKLIKWYFTLDHYHYARWVSVHLYDLIHLHINCPDVSVAFVSGMFCFDKTTRPFSSMAPDQLHEQNNRVIKMFGGATAFLNREDQPGLERWGLCSSELASIIAD